jgi:hypothetical protein
MNLRSVAIIFLAAMSISALVFSVAAVVLNLH